MFITFYFITFISEFWINVAMTINWLVNDNITIEQLLFLEQFN